MSEEVTKNKIDSDDTLLSLDNVLSYKIALGDIFWVKKIKPKLE